MPTLVVQAPGVIRLLDPADGVAIVGRSTTATIQVLDERISRQHLRLQPEPQGWRAVDLSSNGAFFQGQRYGSFFPLQDNMTIHLGDPQGLALTFGLSYSDPTQLAPPVADAVAETTTAAPVSGVAVAAPPPAPEAVGTAAGQAAVPQPAPDPQDSDPQKAPASAAELVAAAVEVALRAITAGLALLPALSDPQFTPRVTAALANLRDLERITAEAAAVTPGAPALALALGAVRKTSAELIGYAAQAPAAALGWRFFAARRAAGLSLDEAAHAVGLEPAAVHAAEGGVAVDPGTAAALQSLVDQVTGQR
ncbi:FHA domain-containing protein [Mycobacterium sp. BK086]|uniref:FHA domain-containing protein n=1 Tax=Mycobacterium sp. BK086 TaxID=2512165 RepID=UPI0025703FF2|nr:FHA domain-containing protein [Mycobacterium sp. BK086]